MRLFIYLPQSKPYLSEKARSIIMEKMKLLDQVKEKIRLKHLSIRTETAYVYWIRRYIIHHNKRHPSLMGEAEVTEFLSFLAQKEYVSPSTQNQALNALLFLYQKVLNKTLGNLSDVVRANRSKRLPVVFTKKEINEIISHLNGDHRLIVQMLYGAGLRLMEGLR